MTTLRSFRPSDLYRFNSINLDPLTETYSIAFYMQYLLTWPSLCAVCEAPNRNLMGYILGKAEGQGNLWHGHVTAVTVASEYRRIGLASRLMNHLEKGSEELYNAYFVDLFVRVTNVLAQLMYTGLDYHVYRRVLEYYSGEEDAFDMRKALSRDKDKKSIIPMTRAVTPDEVEW